MLIFIYHPNSSSSILIDPVRKNKKWKCFVQLHHRFSDQQKRNNEMLLILVIIHKLMSAYLSSVAAENRPGAYSLPSGGFLEV